MNIYTSSEQQDKKYSPKLALTAASFILETKTGRKQRLNGACVEKAPKKVTLEKVNALTEQVIADTTLIYQ
jgi:hypothetical protein